MQRAGTLRYMGPPRPGPLLNRPRGDKCSEQGRPSQANRGPKNLGRSVLLSRRNLSPTLACLLAIFTPHTPIATVRFDILSDGRLSHSPG
jgi:hypothetical protein